MNDNDLYASWGDAFLEAVEGICFPSGQDAYEVVVTAFDRALSLEEFHSLAEDDFVRLRDAAGSVLESDRIETAHMRKAVQILRRRQPLTEK